MYKYKDLKPQLFTDKGQRDFLKIRDNAIKLLESVGAFTTLKPCTGITGDSWEMLACVDRLVELGEIREIKRGDVAAQSRIFVR